MCGRKSSCRDLVRSKQKEFEAKPELLRVANVDTIFLFCLPPYADEEKMKNEDLSRGLAVGLCHASGLSDQRPSQKLYVPPTTLSAVLAAARLATSSDYFQWPPSLRQKV